MTLSSRRSLSVCKFSIKENIEVELPRSGAGPYHYNSTVKRDALATEERGKKRIQPQHFSQKRPKRVSRATRHLIEYQS